MADEKSYDVDDEGRLVEPEDSEEANFEENLTFDD